MSTSSLLLCPRSPGPIPDPILIARISDRFTTLDSTRRLTGSLAHDNKLNGCAIPPLISAGFKGRWKVSPWSKRPRERVVDGRESEVDGLLEKEGIPSNEEEVEGRRKRLRAKKVEIVETASASGKGKGKAKVPPASRQLSLSSLGTSSKPSLTNSSSKPKPPPSKRTSPPSKKPSPLPIPRADLPGKSKELSPISKSSPPTPSGSNEKEEGKQEEEKNQGGRSLGEDEEVLFEMGCTQVSLNLLDPPTALHSDFYLCPDVVDGAQPRRPANFLPLPRLSILPLALAFPPELPDTNKPNQPTHLHSLSN
ncbi:hypothetical protein P7C70_g9214, partial [Phenoliferia sp. Uapishka_3]